MLSEFRTRSPQSRFTPNGSPSYRELVAARRGRSIPAGSAPGKRRITISYNITDVDNLASVLGDLQKRVRNLETASPTSLIVTDPNGIKRAEFGYDPATIPGDVYGMRVNDASGNAIFATGTGLSSALLASGAAMPTAFSLTRTAIVLIVGVLTFENTSSLTGLGPTFTMSLDGTALFMFSGRNEPIE